MTQLVSAQLTVDNKLLLVAEKGKSCCPSSLDLGELLCVEAGEGMYVSSTVG